MSSPIINSRIGNECCNRPSIANLDYKKANGMDYHNVIEVTNRVCTNCYAHWFGYLGEIKQYTKKEWDEMINKAFDE